MQGFAPLLAKASEVSGASKYVPKALLPYKRTCHMWEMQDDVSC